MRDGPAWALLHPRLALTCPAGPLGPGDVTVGEPVAGAAGAVDLKTLLRERLAPLPAGDRDRLVAAVATAAMTGVAGTQPRTPEALHDLREALRERRPRAAAGAAPPLSIALVARADVRTFFVGGRLRDDDAPAVRLTAVAPEGHRAELLGLLTRDGDDFACTFELPAPSALDAGWLFELEAADGAELEVEASPALAEPVEARDALLARSIGADGALDDHAARAIGRIQAAAQTDVGVDEIVQFGRPPGDPDLTVVVPLNHNLYFVEQQLAEFADDPELRAVDLLYVLDSPEVAGDLVGYARQLAEIYDVPFRVAVLGRNLGYAGANNAGARLARGRLLLLLNSDVVPTAPGWLGALVAAHDAMPGIGALGPKLLYEDDTLQHAGVYFRRAPDGVWENAHFYKGLSGTLPAANLARSVPAVTGACLLIDRALFERVGGLSGDYVQGDYEDTDLCLRLLEEGHENRYVPDVALYHLEGQSYASDARRRNTAYNARLHTRRWGQRIAELMSTQEAAS
jgi:GT2 family glycosyltransferase